MFKCPMLILGIGLILGGIISYFENGGWKNEL